MTEADILYFGPSKIMDLIFKNNVWTSNHTPKFSRDEWRQALKTAYNTQPLSNPDAIGSYHYQQTVTYYPYYLQWVAPSKEAFEKTVEEIFKKPFNETVEEIRDKGGRFWIYSVINYGLRGLPLERAIVSFINNGIQSGDLEYLEEAYHDYNQRFPKSSQRAYIDQIMRPYLSSKTKGSVPGILLDSLSENYRNIEEIIRHHRGRVVYVDLWGSWCGPCREQFSHAEALKKRFEGRPVDFVYIAFEHSKDPKKTWKESVFFYNLQGRHILGRKELEDHFRVLYDQNGTLLFPSYLLFDKKGNMITKWAERPDSEESLYEQIEKHL